MIDVVASRPNYWRHLAPVVDALRAEGHDVHVWATSHGQPWGPWHAGRKMNGVVLVASWADARNYRRNRVVYLEHGAGQTYQLPPRMSAGGYSGADGLDNVVLFLGPGDHVAKRWRSTYPTVPALSIGCPALDAHYRRLAGVTVDDGQLTQRRLPVVAFSNRWQSGVIPESMPALDLYIQAIFELTDVTVIGHSHPRNARRTREMWDAHGIPWEPDPEVVLATADVLVHDSSSLMYEAAALDVPVLALNRPSYRRDVEHGLRFWSYVPGLECDHPEGLHRMIERALADPPEAKALRERAAAHVYRYRDEHCAARAATAIEGVL